MRRMLGETRRLKAVMPKPAKAFVPPAARVGRRKKKRRRSGDDVARRTRPPIS
jgi:hypothetical protein